MSTIKVTNINDTSNNASIVTGNNAFTVNGTVVTGVSAGSVTVTAEGGSTTTNLQQGLAKAWIKKAADGASILDSTNVSSLTDTATGQFSVVINNDMGNANYACSSAIFNNNGTVIETCEIRSSSPAPATGSFGAENASVNSSNNRADTDSISSIVIHGDLA